MADMEDVFRRAGERFRSAANTSLEDAGPQRLRYHLLRLTVVGLTREDVRELGELARLAFQDADVREQASKIKQNPDASPLAFAIADIVEQASTGLGGAVSPKSVMFGAVLGAYAGLDAIPDVNAPFAATLGAIAGAIATSTSTFVTDDISRQSWFEYLRMDD